MADPLPRVEGQAVHIQTAPALEGQTSEGTNSKMELTQPPPQTPQTISLRPPLHFENRTPTDTTTPPPLSWLQTTWSVTHSTLPIWKKAKNVRITYKILEGGRLDDEVVYEDVNGKEEGVLEKVLGLRRVKGIDWPISPFTSGEGEEGGKGRNEKWHWKGKGWLKVAGGSRWEVLGWGESESSELASGENRKERWAVTYFEKSLFTPAGLDIYCDRKEGISKGLYEKIIQELKRVGDREGCGDLGILVGEMVEVVID